MVSGNSGDQVSTERRKQGCNFRSTTTTERKRSKLLFYKPFQFACFLINLSEPAPGVHFRWLSVQFFTKLSTENVGGRAVGHSTRLRHNPPTVNR